MSRLSGLERINKALHLGESDTIPHVEMLIDAKVRNAILPNSTYDDFVEHMDIDGIVVYDKLSSWKFELIDAEKKIKRDQWGGLIRFTEEDMGISVGTAFKSEKDMDGYKAPDPDEEWRYNRMREVVKRFKGERAIIAQVNDVFNTVQESLIPHAQYFEAMVTNPDLVDRLNQIVLDYSLRYLKNCIEVGADVVFVSGDYAMTKGPMVSPKHTARFLTPNLKQQVELVHSLGKPVIKHSDGNIWKIIDLIIGTGVNGIHPFDIIAGMDIGVAKEKYGKKICLLGNVNAGTTLCEGSVESVRNEVKECIRKAGAGGGYICSSSNSIHSGVRPENYVAMIKAIREFGKYPLSV